MRLLIGTCRMAVIPLPTIETSLTDTNNSKKSRKSNGL